MSIQKRNMPRKTQNSPEFSRVEMQSGKTMDYKKMDTEALERLLLDRINELNREGVVDHHFYQLHSLKEDSGPTFFLDLIPVFLNDVRASLNDMAKILYQQVVDFKKIYSHYIKLKGSSACFGACRIRDACANLHQANENKSKDGCLQALNRINDEYNNLYEQLDSVIKMEQEIVSRTIGQQS